LKEKAKSIINGTGLPGRSVLLALYYSGGEAYACQGSIKFMNAIFAWAPGGMEVVLILVVILVLFGSKKIPDFARGLGQGIKEFKKASREVTDEIQNTTADTPQKPAANGQSQPAPTAPQSSNPPKA
jgi:sec-independent protein translocase protein TatA